MSDDISMADVLTIADEAGWEKLPGAPLPGCSAWRGELAGSRSLCILPDPNLIADPALREVVLMRHVAMFSGECPACGARMQVPNRAERRRLKRAGEIGHMTMNHEHWCPVSDEAALETAMARNN